MTTVGIKTPYNHTIYQTTDHTICPYRHSQYFDFFIMKILIVFQ